MEGKRRRDKSSCCVYQVPCYTRQLKISGIVLKLFFVVEMNLKCHLVVHLFLHRGGSDVTQYDGQWSFKVENHLDERARGCWGAQDYNRMTFFPVQAIQQENIIFS